MFSLGKKGHSTMVTGLRSLGVNLKEAYISCVRNHGLLEGEALFKQHLTDVNKKRGLNGGREGDPKFSIRALAEGCLGENWADNYRAGCILIQRHMVEAQGAIDVSAFSNITGQLLIDKVRDNYEGPEFIGDQLMETIGVTNGNLGKHRVPWLSRVKDDPGVLQPMQPYPETQFVEQYIDLPAVEKRGEKISISMEAIYADLTKQMVERAQDIGYRIRYQKEERQIRVVAGIVNNWVYGGNAFNTYLNGSIYTNLVSGNQILDYRGIAQLELLFQNMQDLVTGKAIMVPPESMSVLCVPYKIPELKIAFHAARTRSGPYGQTGATNTQAEFEGVPTINDKDYPLVKSQILWRLLTDTAVNGGQALTPTQAKEYVFMGNFKKAFVYREVEPFKTEQAPPGNPAEFEQDIVVQVKVREWGVAGVQAPQYVVWSSNT